MLVLMVEQDIANNECRLLPRIPLSLNFRHQPRQQSNEFKTISFSLFGQMREQADGLLSDH